MREQCICSAATEQGLLAGLGSPSTLGPQRPPLGSPGNAQSVQQHLPSCGICQTWSCSMALPCAALCACNFSIYFWQGLNQNLNLGGGKESKSEKGRDYTMKQATSQTTAAQCPKRCERSSNSQLHLPPPRALPQVPPASSLFPLAAPERQRPVHPWPYTEDALLQCLKEKRLLFSG